MKKELAELACRRRRSIETIEAQRMQLAEISQHWQKPLARVDVGLSMVRLIRQNPVLLAGAMAAFMAFRNTGIVGLVKIGGRLLYLYPSAIFSGLKYISLVLRSPSKNHNKEIDQ